MESMLPSAFDHLSDEVLGNSVVALSGEGAENLSLFISADC